jgi:hypothetical protein
MQIKDIPQDMLHVLGGLRNNKDILSISNSMFTLNHHKQLMRCLPESLKYFSDSTSRVKGAKNCNGAASDRSGCDYNGILHSISFLLKLLLIE